MKIKLANGLIIGLFVLGSGVNAHALTINDFTDGYDVTNWTQTLDGGSIDLTGAPNTISMTSSNSGIGDPTNQDFTIAALGDGSVSFNYEYNVNEIPIFDPFGWVLNGAFTIATNAVGGSPQFGGVSFSVLPGDVFGFRAASTDSLFAAATTIISQFSAPGQSNGPSAPVPEPATMLLFGTGLAGLAVFSIRRKKKA